MFTMRFACQNILPFYDFTQTPVTKVGVTFSSNEIETQDKLYHGLIQVIFPQDRTRIA